MEMAAAPADVEMNTAVSGGKVEQESSEEESESSEEESSEASSSSEDEEQVDKKDEGALEIVRGCMREGEVSSPIGLIMMIWSVLKY